MRRAQWVSLVVSLFVWQLACAWLLPNSVHAQTWSLSRERPSLREIIAVDATSEAQWPYGQEDVADDAGIGAAEVADVDLRSLYADLRDGTLWLRSYVVSTAAPDPNAEAYFFIDSDANAATGGKANDAQLWPRLSADPSPGGYEHVVSVRGDGTLGGLFDWDASKRRWVEPANAGMLVKTEALVARDPLRLLGNNHGYFQASLGSATAGVNDSCIANIFVRTWYEQPVDAGTGVEPNGVGDYLDAFAAHCHATLSYYGDPIILHADACTTNATCPAAGTCTDGICVFGYECAATPECATGYSCTNQVCVRVIETACTTNATCDGLICDASSCVTCTATGAHACDAGLVCSPSGRCLNPDNASQPGQAGRGGSGVAAGEDGPRVRGGAFTCAVLHAGSSADLSWPWLLGAIFGLCAFTGRAARRRRERRTHRTNGAWRALLWLLLPCCLWLGQQNVHAQEDIDTQRFQPHATSGGFLQTETTQTRYPVDPFSLGVWLSYAHQPLVVVDDNGNIIEKVVGSQLGFDVTGAYAFANWFELGMHVPLSYLSGDDLSNVALGDVRLVPKFSFLRDDRDGIGIGLLTELRLPTHTSRFAGGARNLAGALRFLLDHRFGLSGFRLGVDLGFLIREATHYRSVNAVNRVTAASEFQAGLGLGYRFGGGRAPVEILFDLRSALGLAELDPEEASLEAFGGIIWHLTAEWKLHAALGLGLLEGFGVPTFRPLLGLRWEPSPNDPDHDGQKTSEKLLEKQREELDPNAKQEAESPDAKNADAVDDAERAQAIREGYDACPNLPEDYDGIEDDDGCPEGDEDHDGVLDYLDQCPHEDETINGFEDEDGCPDEGPAQIVIESGKIQILETIRFRPNSSEIESESYPVMNQIALALRKHNELQHVEIEGHTDNTGPREFNMALSRSRARSVRQYLLSRGGIDPARLTAVGYGPDRPLADNNTEEGRAKNRRVEFVAR